MKKAVYAVVDCIVCLFICASSGKITCLYIGWGCPYSLFAMSAIYGGSKCLQDGVGSIKYFEREGFVIDDLVIDDLIS